MKLPLENHTAIITGALGDIGQAIAHELAARGSHVALCDLKAPAEASRVLDDLQKRNVRATYHRVDVSQYDEVQVWIADVETQIGAPTIIIPNAATVTLKDVRHVAPDEWTRELAINLNGAFWPAQIAANRLAQLQKSGRIVFVGSWAAHAPHPHIPAYSVAKAGLRMAMQCLALEFAPHDILVNEVAPGFVEAGLSARLWDERPDWKAQSLERVPVRKLISAQDVARAVVSLCDFEDVHTTGSVRLMDGGLSLLRR
jgi:glucose 1-dehydrogenase